MCPREVQNGCEGESVHGESDQILQQAAQGSGGVLFLEVYKGTYGHIAETCGVSDGAC